MSECERNHTWINTYDGIECKYCDEYIDADKFIALEDLMLEFISKSDIYEVIENE